MIHQKLSSYLAILLITIIASGITYYLVRQSTEVESADMFPLAVQYQISNTPDDSTDTSDWKTYRHEKYGFEFRYPSDWQGDVDGIYSKATLDFWEATDPASLMHVPPDISILVLSKSDAAHRQKSYSEAEEKLIRVGGKEAILYTTVTPDKDMVVFIENAGSVISLRAIYDSNFGVFNQILSTFKFIE